MNWARRRALPILGAGVAAAILSAALLTSRGPEQLPAGRRTGSPCCSC